MLASESYLACLSMNHLFFKLIIKMQVFEHFLITGFISYAYCCHGNLHQQPKYITLRGNKYLRQIFSFRFLFFHPDIKIHLVSILSEGIFDKIFFLNTFLGRTQPYTKSTRKYLPPLRKQCDILWVSTKPRYIFHVTDSAVNSEPPIFNDLAKFSVRKKPF